MTLIERHQKAERKTVEELTAAEIRLLVAQYSAGPPSIDIVRKALELLDKNPLLEAEYFQGDLLKAVLELPADFWANHQIEWAETHAILKSMDDAVKIVNAAKTDFLSIE